MTDERVQQKFKELIYDLGEYRFDAIKTAFWHKHINFNEDFNEEQMKVFKDFIEDIYEQNVQAQR